MPGSIIQTKLFVPRRRAATVPHGALCTCKPSQEAWVTNRYPLRELGLNRADCEAWLLKRYKIVVSKSACLGCLRWNTGPQSGAVALAHHGSRTLKRLRCRKVLARQPGRCA
jgi:hypothetical protein